jgi:hypothetical protein
MSPESDLTRRPASGPGLPGWMDFNRHDPICGCIGDGLDAYAAHAATHVPLALRGYATTSSVLAIGTPPPSGRETQSWSPVR